jgi:hypothetical protein
VKYKIKPFFYSQGKYVFWEYYLKDHNRDWKNPFGIYFERFNENDYEILEKTFKEMDAKERLFDLDETKRRIQNNHKFYVAKKNNDIIGSFWVIINHFRISFFNGTIYLKDNEGLSLNANIMKAYRGNGIYNRIKAYAFDDLKKAGYERMIGFYWHRNKAAIRMNERFGSQIIGEVKHYNLLTLIFRYHNLLIDKLVFHDGPLLYWKLLYRKIKKILQN